MHTVKETCSSCRTNMGKEKCKMAKRLIDTGLVSQNWYQNLDPKKKALYIHLLCSCDVAGVFEVNYRLMSAYIGDQISEQDLFGAFGKRVIPLTNHKDKGMLVDFVSFQCGGRINPNVKVHQSIIKRLHELGISIQDLQKWCNHGLEFCGVEPKKNATEEKQKPQEEKEYASTKELNNFNVEVEERKTRDQYDYHLAFDRFYSVYPRHDSKQAAFIKLCKILKECKTDECRNALLERMINAVKKQRESDQWTKDGGKFIPMPSTWLNQRRWEDEGLVEEDPKTNLERYKTISSIVSGMKV